MKTPMVYNDLVRRPRILKAKNGHWICRSKVRYWVFEGFGPTPSAAFVDWAIEALNFVKAEIVLMEKGSALYQMHKGQGLGS